MTALMSAEEVLAVMDHHAALKRIAYDHPTGNADADRVREVAYRKAVDARIAVAAMAEREAALVAERDSLRKRSREMCQALVNAVGADGPCNAEDAAAKLVSERDALRAKISELEERCAEQSINARASSQAAHEARVELSLATATIALLEAQNTEMRTYFENALRADIDRYHSFLERKDLP